jgi:hypothetical protein
MKKGTLVGVGTAAVASGIGTGVYAAPQSPPTPLFSVTAGTVVYTPNC